MMISSSPRAVLPVQQVFRDPPDRGFTPPGVAYKAGDSCLQFREAAIGIAQNLFGQAAAWYCDAGLLALGDAVTGGGRRIERLATPAKRAIRVDDVHVVAFLKYPMKIVVLKIQCPFASSTPAGARLPAGCSLGCALGTQIGKPDALFIPHL